MVDKGHCLGTEKTEALGKERMMTRVIEMKRHNYTKRMVQNKGIRDAGSTADIRMLLPWSALVCLGLL